MSDKAAKKKQYILDTAKKVFAKKGFKSVTMKDIVEACEISRGGLYIYFDSTDAVFEEIMSQESAANELYSNYFSEEGHSAGEKLAWFLTEQKKSILKHEEDLSVALFEYLLYKHSEGTQFALAQTNRQEILSMLADVIDEGNETGEFYAEDAYEAAKHILFVLDGIRFTAMTLGVTEEDVETECIDLLSGLVADEG